MRSQALMLYGILVLYLYLSTPLLHHGASIPTASPCLSLLDAPPPHASPAQP
ncbi:hypothetical protein LguiB_026990 [Lonicera macranthoides]